MSVSRSRVNQLNKYDYVENLLELSPPIPSGSQNWSPIRDLEAT